MDEREGPFKVVSHLVNPRDSLHYSIVRQQRQGNDIFFIEIVPNAGTGETARKLVNLLNKDHKEKFDELDSGEADGTAEGRAGRVDGDDLGGSGT